SDGDPQPGLRLRARRLDALRRAAAPVVDSGGPVGLAAEGATEGRADRRTDMAAARNGDVELHYETLGPVGEPVLLLGGGLGGQCIDFDDDFCGRFVARGARVVRFDNRDAGLSTKLDGHQYLIWDMALDALAVLDAVGAERAHVLGVSMGGMIAQSLAIAHPERLLT